MLNHPSSKFRPGRSVIHLFSVLVITGTAVSGIPSKTFSQDFLNTRSTEHVNIVGKVPLAQHEFNDQLILFFDQEIVKPTAEGDHPEEPVRFEPALDGRTSMSGNALSFIPSSVTPEQIYRVIVNPELRSKTGEPLNPKHREFRLATAPFRVKRIWEIEESDDRAVMGISLTYAAELDALRNHLSVKTPEGKDVAFDLEQGESENVYRLTLTDLSDLPIRITVSSGLKDETGTFSTRRDFTNVYPREQVLIVRGISWGEYSTDSQVIRIHFSKKVDARDVDNHLSVQEKKLDQALKYTLTSSGVEDQHTLRIAAPDPADTKVAVTLTEGLTSAQGFPLVRTFSGVIEHSASPFAVRYTDWTYEGKEGTPLQVNLNHAIRNVINAEELLKYIEVTPELPGSSVGYVSWSDRSFRIYGDWIENQSYQITLKPGLPYTEVSSLQKPVSIHVKPENLRPWLGFGYENQFYLPERHGILLPLYSRGTSECEVTLYRLFPSNIAVSLDRMRNGQGSRGFIESYCERLATKKITMSGNTAGLTKTAIAFDTLMPRNRRGVFCLEAQDTSEGHRWRRDAKIVLFTDIGVLAHWRNEELILFAHDLYSLTPLSNAVVTVYSNKNQVLGEARTDIHGIAHITDMNEEWGRPTVAVVEHGQDFTFLELDKRNEGTDEIQPSMPSYDAEAYDGFLYADRDLYRPGETVHLRWIVRTNYGDALPNVPLLLTIDKPNGKELLSQPVTLSEFGSGKLDLETQSAYPTGRYHVKLSVPGSNRSVGRYFFRLEEFVPNRIETKVTIEEDIWRAGEKAKVQVTAKHLFGPPATNRKAEATVYLRRGGFEPENWKAYHFGNDSEYTSETISLGESRTNEEGTAEFEFTYPPNSKVTFPLTATVIGRVFELGGRSVSDRATAVLSPDDILLGISAEPQTNRSGIAVNVAAIQPDETPATIDSATVTLERQVWNYYVRRYYDNNQPSWTESFNEVESRSISLHEGRGTTEFQIEQSGYYRVRVQSDKTTQYSTLTFYSYNGRTQLTDATRPSLIKITADKKQYTIGDEAVIRVESPFDGCGIIVLQNGSIQKMIPVEIEDQAATVRIPISESDYPNLWVEATVIHAVQKEHAQMYPFSSFAMTSLGVMQPKRKLDISMPDLPEEIRPSSTKEFSIQVRDNHGEPVEAEVTLAAVDEGIHAITNYQTPQPYEYFGRPRKPDFRRAHYYDRVVYDYERTAPGGGMDAELAKRAESDLENWIKPVALWSGVVKTDADGNATVTLEIPEFSGTLRFVAIGCSKKACGSFEDEMLVRRDFILRTNMPRFLLPGDSSQCRAVLFNNGKIPCVAKVKWDVTGALQPTTGTANLEIPVQGERSVMVNIIAGDESGQGQIVWDVTVVSKDGEPLDILSETAPLPVEPPAAFQSHAEIQTLKPGETIEIRNEKFLDDKRAEIELTVGGHPALQLKEALSYLIQYPYGCVEQVTSRLMPLYLLRQNELLIEDVLESGESVKSYIDAGIDLLFAMQTDSGGLGFWPGARSPYPYGSVYAFHFLTLIKNDRQIAVPNTNYESLKQYVRSIAMDWSDDSKSTLYQRAYAIYTLALSGDADAIRQIPRFDDVVLPRSARYLLAAALARSTQDNERVQLYLSETPAEPYLVTEPDGTLNSDIRNTAVELLALLQMDADPSSVAEKANRLAVFLQNNRHGTTQESAFVVSALGEYLAGITENIENAKAVIEYSGGSSSDRNEISGSESYHKAHTGPGGAFHVVNTGETELFLNIVTRGIPKEPQTEPVSKGISVHRQAYLENGEKLTQPDFQQTENYVIDIVLSAEQDLRNVVVVDLLSAGLEVENPRLDPNMSLREGTFSGADNPSYLDIRDDRLILAFDELKQGEHHFYYVVRAITPGEYHYPSIEAECMYVPLIRGQSVPITIQVH